MSLFGTLLSKIFPRNHPANAAVPTGSAQSAPAQQAGQGAATQQATASSQGGGATGVPPGGGGAATPAQASAMTQVDVERILDDMARQNSQKLNWRTSIVDLMKLVGMDSSLNARKELANELNYSGDTSDSASMNIWLHKQVMTRIAQNGGKVPKELLH